MVQSSFNNLQVIFRDLLRSKLTFKLNRVSAPDELTLQGQIVLFKYLQ